MSIVSTSRRIWIVVSAGLVTVTALVAIVRAVVKVDDIEAAGVATKAELKAEIELLKKYERRSTGRVHKIDVKTDLIMERLGMPIPMHLRAPEEGEP